MTIVSSYNEWDPLQEVIVGSVKGAMKMPLEPLTKALFEASLSQENIRKFQSSVFTDEEIQEAEAQLDGLATILEMQGITVKRPESINYAQKVITPAFKIKSGNCSACPRDTIMIIGNRIIEASMSFRSRYFEHLAYRKLIKDYFLKGAKWVAAPKPSMFDDLYVSNYSLDDSPFDAVEHNALTEFEPSFDAASFVRFGRDIFYQLDLVTNQFAVKWLESELGNDFKFHKIKFHNKLIPTHIDTTLIPIRPGLLLVNPERPCIDGSLDFFKKNNWKVIDGLPSINKSKVHSPSVSNWISMNFLSIDEETVIVEEKEEPMIKLLESLDCKVITCPFDKVYKFGGGVHCCTVDIRRNGTLQSYFRES